MYNSFTLNYKYTLQSIVNGLGGRHGRHAPKHVEEEDAHTVEENP